MTKDHSNPKYIKVEVLTLKVRTEPIIREAIKIGVDWAIGQIVGAEDSMEVIRPRFQQNPRGNNFQENIRGYGRQNSRGEYRNNRHDGYSRSRDRSREGSFSRNYGNNRERSSSNSRLRSGSRASTNRDRIRCHNCREYYHCKGLSQL